MRTDPGPFYAARSDIDPSVVGLLDERRTAVLGTHNQNGSVHLVPVWFLFEDGRFVVETSSTTRKVRNIRSRPHATVLVQGDDGWVSGSGRAEIVSGSEAAALNQRLRARYLTEAGRRTIGRYFGEIDDVALIVVPDRWRSWSFSATFPALEKAGLDLEDMADWFLPHP